VASGKTTILIDAGPDIAQQLKRAKPRHIDAVLLTHGHEDAIGGLKDLDDWVGHVRSPEPVPVFTDRLTAECLTTRFGALRHLRFMQLKGYVPFTVARTQITPVPVRHAHDKKIKTFGYLFESFCYASDFYSLPERTKLLLKGIKTLILDGAMYFGVHVPTHMSTDATIRLASELKTERLILTQTGHTYPPHDQAQIALRRYAAAEHLYSPKTVILAYDGLRIRT
jgi:phosphoribosyl 1,2-cyclic phosphate phosphodiesterase